MKNDSADKWTKTEIRPRGKKGGPVKLKASSTVVNVITGSLLESQPRATKHLGFFHFLSMQNLPKLQWLTGLPQSWFNIKKYFFIYLDSNK